VPPPPLPPFPPVTGLGRCIFKFSERYWRRRFDTRGLVGIFAENHLFFPLGGGILSM